MGSTGKHRGRPRIAAGCIQPDGANERFGADHVDAHSPTFAVTRQLSSGYVKEVMMSSQALSLSVTS